MNKAIGKEGTFVGISNGRDTLQRVAFELSDGTFYKFAINPQDMTDSYQARNNFIQAERNMFMQGYGPGLHTIQISGTTGVNRGAGFDKMVELKKVLTTQLNTGHDDTVGAGLVMKFHNFTNGESWQVEFSPEGFQFNQSVNNPLSYTYTINMVVVGAADTPTTSETSWVVLGNLNPSVSPKQVDTNYNYKYGKTQVSGEFDGSGYSALVNRINRDTTTSVLDYNSFFDKGHQTVGMYSYGRILTGSQLESLYKWVYPDINKGFNWKKYLSANGVILRNTKGTVRGYGQAGQADTGSIVKVMSADEIYNTLYGQTVNDIDIQSYADASKLHDQLYASALSPLSRDTYMNYVATTFKKDNGEDLEVMNPSEIQRVYKSVYGNNLPVFDQDGIYDLALMYEAMRAGSIDNFNTQYDLGLYDTSDVSLGDVTSLFEILTGTTPSMSDLENSQAVMNNVSQGVADTLHPYHTSDQLTIDTIARQYQASIDEGFDNEWNHITDSTDSNRYDKNLGSKYLNPVVSDNAPIYAYYETKNILKV